MKTKPPLSLLAGRACHAGTKPARNSAKTPKSGRSDDLKCTKKDTGDLTQSSEAQPKASASGSAPSLRQPRRNLADPH